MKLSKKVINAFVYDANCKGKDIRWDDTLPGFGLRIYPTGKKSFVLSYRINGRKRLMTIKDKRILSLDEARIIAKKLLANLDKEDPLDAKQKLARGGTIKDLCTTYMERYSKLKKKTWETDELRINNRIIPLWGNLKIPNLKHSDVESLHYQIGNNEKHTYEANRTIELISKMFQLARRWGFVPETHINPARNIEHYKEEKRDRWVTHEELPMLTEAIDEVDNIYMRNALWLYLLTGARKSEILRAKWSDLNLERKELKLPDTKSGRIHYIPLTEPALALLRNISVIQDNPYIFPGVKSGHHIVNIDKTWRKVRDRATVKLWSIHANPLLAVLIRNLSNDLNRMPTLQEIVKDACFNLPTGIRDVRLHDLRRTVGSWMAQSGNSLHLIGRVLNHSNQSTTAVYARFGQDQLRHALERHAEQIMGVANKKSGALVVDLNH